MPEETVQINSTTTYFQETKIYVEKTTLRREEQNDHNNDIYGWTLVAVFLGVLILICGINMLYLFYRKSRFCLTVILSYTSKDNVQQHNSILFSRINS